MSRSLQSTFATKPLCWHTCPSSGDDLECDTDLDSHDLATGNPWPPPPWLSVTHSPTYKLYGHYPILIGDNASLLVSVTLGELNALGCPGRQYHTGLIQIATILLMLLPSSTKTISTPLSLKRYMLRLNHTLLIPPTPRCMTKSPSIFFTLPSTCWCLAWELSCTGASNPNTTPKLIITLHLTAFI